MALAPRCRMRAPRAFGGLGAAGGGRASGALKATLKLALRGNVMF